MTSAVFFLRVGAILGGLAVAAGAFGAHGLRERLSPEMLNVFEVAVRYQMYHALAMIAAALGVAGLWESRWMGYACWAWLTGVVVFSGSLYLLTLTGQKWLGAITPIGGVAFILGWVFLAIAAGALAK
jgi:uncharacterized membrane protein YgdD (TMEM256/DUF423 family)